MGFFFGGGGKIGEGVVRYWPPTNSFLLFGVLTSVPILVKIDQEKPPWECSQSHTHRHTDANRFYNLSHAICYSYGTDNYSKAITASHVRFPALLELNAICYWIRKTSLGCPPLTETDLWKCDNLPKSTLECTRDMKGLACDVQWVFLQFFAICIPSVYRSLIHEQFPIWYCIRSAQCCANGIFVPMDGPAILTARYGRCGLPAAGE